MQAVAKKTAILHVLRKSAKNDTKFLKGNTLKLNSCKNASSKKAGNQYCKFLEFELKVRQDYLKETL